MCLGLALAAAARALAGVGVLGAVRARRRALAAVRAGRTLGALLVERDACSTAQAACESSSSVVSTQATQA